MTKTAVKITKPSLLIASSLILASTAASDKKSSERLSLIQAALTDTKKLQKFLNAKNINDKLENGQTALLAACSKAEGPAIDFMVKNLKANVNVLDAKKKTCLHYLLHHNYMNPSSADEKAKIKIAGMLFAKKLNPNVQDFFKESPLHIASYLGYSDMVSLLLKNKARLDLKDQQGQSPLHRTVLGAHYFKEKKNQHHHGKTMDVILAKKPGLNAQDHSSYSALHYASEKGLAPLAKKLIAAGADMNIQTKEGWSPLHLAAGQGQKEIVELLIEKGAKVTIKDKTGAAPIHFAVGYGSKEIVGLLLKVGAISIVDDKIVGINLLDKEKEKKLKELLQKFKSGLTKSSKEEKARKPASKK